MLPILAFSTKYVIEKFGIWNETDPKLCYYRGYRNGEEENYSLQSHYWHVFAARLAFVVIFEVKTNENYEHTIKCNCF